MANKIITLQGLKEKSNKALYGHLLKQKWDKETIIMLLEDSGIEIDDELNLKQLVKKYHDDICECVFEEYQNAY